MAEPPAPVRWLTQRFRWVAAVWRVQERVNEVHGGQLAASVTLNAFTALFPLVLGLSAVAGFLHHSQPDIGNRLVDHLGLTGTAASTLRETFDTADRTRGTATVASALGLLWSGLGLVAGLEAAFDSVWQAGGRGLKGKLNDLAWLLGAVVIVGASIVGTAVVGRLPVVAGIGTLVASLAVTLLLWLWTLKVLTNRDLPWAAHLPGAFVGAIGFAVLSVAGTVLVPRVIRSSSALYGAVGVVLAILSWLLVLGRLVVYAAVVNVLRWEDEHGTVTVEIALPRMPGDVPVEATRSGEQVPT